MSQTGYTHEKNKLKENKKIMSKNVKIGIVGAKFAGGFHTDIWKTLPGAEVAAVVDLSEEARTEFQKKYGIQKTYGDYRELIKDPDIDVVDICVPNFLHAVSDAISVYFRKSLCHTRICEKV
jgi:predicted homoserine dehydrogenase-like protein